MMEESNRLPILAAEIKTALDACNTAAKTAFSEAIVVGERLIEAKALLKHGSWLPWLGNHCRLSERQAQKYMRLARAKDALAAKAPLTADLTIERAIAALSVAKPTNHLPPAGFIKIGDHKSDAIVVAPAFQYPGFFYVTRLTTNKDGTGDMVGGRRPIRHDLVEVMLAAMDSGFTSYNWQDVRSEPWAYNIMLFDTPSDYVDSFNLRDPEDRAECVAIANRDEPVDFGVSLRREIRSVDDPLDGTQ